MLHEILHDETLVRTDVDFDTAFLQILRHNRTDSGDARFREALLERVERLPFLGDFEQTIDLWRAGEADCVHGAVDHRVEKLADAFGVGGGRVDIRLNADGRGAGVAQELLERRIAVVVELNADGEP